MKWSFVKYCMLIMFFVTVESQNQTKIKRIVLPTYKKGSFNFWTFFVALKNLIGDQYSDTKSTIDQLNDITKDGFSDTATTTARPLIQESGDNNSSTTTTTEKYRVSRYEFGRILGRNFRGLQKIFREDLNSALNQSNYNIEGYKQEWQNAIGTPAPKQLGKTSGAQKKRRKVTTAAPRSIFGF